MPTLAVSGHPRRTTLGERAPAALAGTAVELEQARESLHYWEARGQTLPRHAVRRRREAREMAERWRERVAEAEREHYGRGLLGAALLLATERRLPEPARHAGRVAARRATQVAVAVTVVVLSALVLGAALVVQVLAALLAALG
jgi:hypothetical protein